MNILKLGWAAPASRIAVSAALVLSGLVTGCRDSDPPSTSPTPAATSPSEIIDPTATPSLPSPEVTPSPTRVPSPPEGSPSPTTAPASQAPTSTPSPEDTPTAAAPTPTPGEEETASPTEGTAEPSTPGPGTQGPTPPPTEAPTAGPTPPPTDAPTPTEPPTPEPTAEPTAPVDADDDGYPASEDCDDEDPAVHPGAAETCDQEQDLNCDGSVSFTDADDDGFAACRECNDADAEINPDALEICDGQDNNCDGLVDDEDPGVVDPVSWYADTDGDGYGDGDSAVASCELPDGYVANAEDCDDQDPDQSPETVWFADTDGDTYGDGGSPQVQCEQPAGHVRDDADCLDSNPDVNPAGEEVCNGLDDDCDGEIDGPSSSDAQVFYPDTDGDGVGDTTQAVVDCAAPSGYVESGGDCDDGDPSSFPGAEEACDSTDTDCDGSTNSGAEGEASACALLDCLAIKQARPDATDGIYWVDLDGGGSSAPFQVFCDMSSDGGGWTMVYKISEGVAGDPYALWTGGPVGESDTALLDTGKDSGHYVNRIINSYWNQSGYEVSEVRVHVYKAGVQQKYVRFIGRGSDRNNWFSSSRLIDSSWRDITSEPQNFFSIEGDGAYNRRFFLYRNYGGCSADNGWLVADTGSDPCSWESTYPNLRILYATGDVYQNYETGTNNGTLGRADAMGVFVRRHEDCRDGVDNDGDAQVDEFDGIVGSDPWCPGVSCSEILADEPSAPTGSWWLDPDGPPGNRPFRTWCDMDTDGGGWTMVYKLSAGVPGDPWALWSGGPAGDLNPSLADVGPDASHYASPILTRYWNTSHFSVSDVRIELRAQGQAQANLRFNGQSSTYVNWFTAPRLLSSPWANLAAGPFNYFSVEGDGGNGRRFFINSNYGGCEVDSGWLVFDGGGSDCGWESANPSVRLLYSTAAGAVNWHSAVSGGTIGKAEVAVVYVRDAEICGDGVDNDKDGLIDEGMIGGSPDSPAPNCKAIMESCPSARAADGNYWIDPDGGGSIPPTQTWCAMTPSGGGWTAVTDVIASTLTEGISREYLYLYNDRWYRSPFTSLAWNWGAGQEQTGSYAYSNGSIVSAYTCPGSGEKPTFGVGCSSGPGNTPKTLPIYTKDPTTARGNICQDTPNIYGGGVCQENVLILYR